MESRERVDFQPLPGSDALRSARYFDPSIEFDPYTLDIYHTEGGYRKYLHNETYRHYLTQDKYFGDEQQIPHLLATAEELSTEHIPEYLDAAGWAYVEAGLAAKSDSAQARLALISMGEHVWQRKLVHEAFVTESLPLGDEYREEYDGHRTALSLAFVPLMKSIVVGNVPTRTLQRTFNDVLAIGESSVEALNEGYAERNDSAVGHHIGLQFEIITLLASLYMNDPRYVPLPSTSRGGSGIYNRDQTHDAMIINQHWGDIRKVIPIEVKARPSVRDKQRYKALIVPGRSRLSIEGVDSRVTIQAFRHVVEDSATPKEQYAIEKLTTQLREMLRLYQQGNVSINELAINGVMRFHDTAEVVKEYPELTKEPRPSNWMNNRFA